MKRLLLLSLLLLSAGTARADAYDYVLVPYFEPGKFTARLGWGAVDKRTISAAGQSLALGYGVSERWYTEVWISQERDRGQPMGSHGWYWSNQIQLASSGRSDWALYLSYWRPPTSPGGWEWSAGPMWQYAGEAFDLNLNLIIKHWLRPARRMPTEIGYQLQAKRLFAPGWEWGLQAYGEFGELRDIAPLKEQSHLLGPALFGHTAAGGATGIWRYDAALLFGLNSASPRAQLRALLSYQF